MNLMSTLESHGLDVVLIDTIKEFVNSENNVKKVTDELTGLIDKHGFTVRPVLQSLGTFQRSGTIKSGLFKRLKEIEEQVKDLDLLSHPAEESQSNGDNPKVDDPPNESQVVDKDTDDNVFSEMQEQKIQELLQKEEERFKASLLKKEQKWRDKIAKGEEVKAQRLGLNAELTAQVREIKSKIKQNAESVKKLREETVSLKAELNKIRPKKTRGPLSPEQKDRMRVAREAYWANKKAQEGK
jgi:chromosome segregation ATPase